MVLLTGANGQLGTDYKRIFDESNIDYVATDFEELDITKFNNVEEFVKLKNINYIINCAAYNNVDKAEEENELCDRLNHLAPLNLAKIAKKIGAIFVTYSTDFVFDGKKVTPYLETDETNPLSVYGKSKADGEKAVLENYDKSFVIRTSWVFGVGNTNFNTQIMNWSKTRDVLAIVVDQISAPTYSYDLAKYSWELVKTKKYGLYHFSNDGICSKYDQAKYVLNKIGWKGILNIAKTKDFNLPARRAEFTKLDSTKLETLLDIKIPSWKDALDRYLDELEY